MTTRGQILADAFEPIGLAGYVFDITSDEQATAFRYLDRMLAQWEAEGIALGYTAANDDPALSDTMTTPVYADEAISLNLALRLAPGFGKTPSGGLLRQARTAKALVITATATIPTLTRANLGIHGAGSRRAAPDTLFVDDALFDGASVVVNG